MGISLFSASLPVAGSAIGAGAFGGLTVTGDVGLGASLPPADVIANPLPQAEDVAIPFAQRFIPAPRFSTGIFRPADAVHRAIPFTAASDISDMEELVVPIGIRKSHLVEDDDEDDGGGDTDAAGRGLLRAISKIQVYLSKNIKTPDDKECAKSNARLIAKILKAIYFGRDPLAKKAFCDQFKHRWHMLKNVMEYVDQVTGLKFHFSGDGEEEFDIEAVSTPPSVQKVMEALRSVMPPALHGTPFETQVVTSIEQYASAAPSPETRNLRVINRVRAYQDLIANIEAAFELLDVPLASQVEVAVKALAQFHEVIGGRRCVTGLATRRIWAMIVPNLNLQPTQAQAREIIKRHYLLDDKTASSLIASIPKEFCEALAPYIVSRLFDWYELNIFKDWLDRTVQELETAKEAFEDAHEFLGLHISKNERANFAARVVYEIANVKATNRTGVQKMKMFGWRETAKAGSLREVRWPKVAEFAANALGVTIDDVDRAFGSVEYTRYRAYVADAVLKREDSYSALSNALPFIDKSAKRLRHSISLVEEMQKMLPGGAEAGIKKMPEVVISALIREPGVELQGRKLVAVLRPLIGRDRLLQPFSPAAAGEVEQIGIDTYFGSFYSDVHDLPQPLIEASLRFIAAMEKKHHDKVHSHRRRAVGYRRLLDIVDKRLDRVSDLEKRAKIRGEAVDWLAKFDDLPVQDSFEKQFAAWLKYREKLSADAWEEMAGVVPNHAIAEAKRLLVVGMPKRLNDQKIEERIVAAMFDYVRGASSAKMASRSLVRRARFYAEVLQNIYRAAHVLDIKGKDAVSFALDIIDSVNSVVGGRKVYGEESARRAVWLAVNDKYVPGKVTNILSAALEGLYGKPVLDALPQTRDNPRLLLDFLFSVAKSLRTYDRFSAFVARAEKVEANGKMKKARE